MKLYELKKGDLFQVVTEDDTLASMTIRFNHLDGMYSYCTVEPDPYLKIEEPYVIHIAAYADVIKI